MKKKSIKIGDALVGNGAPVHIVFEAGQTHTGFDNAKELIKTAKEAGANAIKFQIYETERLITSLDIPDEYDILVDKKTGEIKTIKEPIFDSLKRHEFSLEQIKQLKDYADSHAITFFATVCFPEEVEFLYDIGVHAFKICSGDVNHHPFLRYVAQKGAPVIIDTGSSTLGEVEKAVDIIRSEGNEKIIINHCPTGYPARLDSINLQTITTLKQMFEYPIAFSDHTPGWDMDIAAVALGVDMIEKTITSDRTYPDAEHIMSVETKDAKKMVSAIRELEIALGSPRPIWTKKQKEDTLQKRRSIFLKRTLHPGDMITEDCIDFKRPGTGILAEYTDIVLGRRVTQEIESHTMLQWKYVR